MVCLDPGSAGIGRCLDGTEALVVDIAIPHSFGEPLGDVDCVGRHRPSDRALRMVGEGDDRTVPQLFYPASSRVLMGTATVGGRGCQVGGAPGAAVGAAFDETAGSHGGALNVWPGLTLGPLFANIVLVRQYFWEREVCMGLPRKRKRTYQWFVEPLDADTNAAIAKELPEENTLRGAHDDLGDRPNVYRIGSSMLSFPRRSRSQNNLKFRIYVQEGNGKMRLASFLQ